MRTPIYVFQLPKPQNGADKRAYQISGQPEETIDKKELTLQYGTPGKIKEVASRAEMLRFQGKIESSARSQWNNNR